ncbi:terpenoid cyclases/protein prenyltransferase alpha-alpha toroid [Aspergillus pseudotamarii]|uniref:Terpenoid cyclases/protein prenyltransferase alpha-alpha toroid n=1 Tax=Aspergillus pseudotamarii TaxID=132259 RepID=A0A5N6T292_ASPPS|nr:terpenoid cyclases/protein prenyltransferase alpha-alpha toroid [Aspergillus pseudotamarii]KAE8140408.1 terpenoid cyclases/protein prenyltransferase alpha-alpha toroid [Aspergillus pseudotamarii]
MHRGAVEHDDWVKDCFRAATDWLKSTQNPDGGWGETGMSDTDPRLAGRGPSTASRTGWALMGLLAHLTADNESVRLGVVYLLRTQTLSDRNDEASWPESHYTGT